MRRTEAEESASVAGGPTGQARGELIAAELIPCLSRNIPTAVAVNAVIAVLMCLALRETLPHERLALWLAAIYVLAIARYFLWRAFQLADLTAAGSSSRWHRYALLGSGLNGLIWGTGGVALYAPDSPASQFLLLITQFGMGAGAAYAAAPSFAAVMAYILPSVVLSSIPFFQAADSVHVTLGVMLWVFVAAATHFTFRI